MADFLLGQIGGTRPQGDQGIAHYCEMFEEDTMAELQAAMNLFYLNLPGASGRASPVTLRTTMGVATGLAGVPQQKYWAYCHYVLVGTI